jgi:hypothetical protein
MIGYFMATNWKNSEECLPAFGATNCLYLPNCLIAELKNARKGAEFLVLTCSLFPVPF